MHPSLGISRSEAKNSMLLVLNRCIGPQLRGVEELFHLELQSALPCVRGLVRHVSRFRGKMLRPSLVFLMGQACGSLRDAHTVVATVAEMVHMATLVHDDVLDEAELRRKGATINHLRGNEAAVLLGDYLISHSYHLCSSLDSQYASRLIGRTTNEVCEGELLQIENRNNLDLDQATYMQIIARKTASLCATCCELGAKLAEAGDQRIEKARQYGLAVGMAFQIQDDILDIVGDAGTVGKTLGIDIEKGKMTLPMIHFLSHAPREHRQLLRSLMQGRETDKVEKIRNLILPSNSIAFARHVAQEQIRSAQQSLEGMEDSEARRVLGAMAQFVVERGV